jgi:hypothetical protein
MNPNAPLKQSSTKEYVQYTIFIWYTLRANKKLHESTLVAVCPTIPANYMCPRRLADKLGGPHPIDVSGREPVQEAKHISVNHVPIKTSERSAWKVDRLSTHFKSYALL